MSVIWWFLQPGSHSVSQSVSTQEGICASQPIMRSVWAAETDTDGLDSVSISLFPPGFTCWLLTWFSLQKFSLLLPVSLSLPPSFCPPPLFFCLLSLFQSFYHHYQAEYTESAPTCIPAGTSFFPASLRPSLSLLLFFSLPEEWCCCV